MDGPEGIDMMKKWIRILLPVFAAVLAVSSVAVLPAGAAASQRVQKADLISEINDIFGADSEESEEETDPQEETEPDYTEPEETEPEWTEPEWTEPEEDYGAYEEEETVDPWDEYAQLVDDAEEPTGMNSVKMDKSVSNKAYSTDYTAGIVSWICVGVGLVVVLVMLVSTKLSGNRA